MLTSAKPSTSRTCTTNHRELLLAWTHQDLLPIRFISFYPNRCYTQDVRPERLVFIQCDTQVDETRIVDVTADEELSMEILNVSGGGGTLFQPVFDWVKDNNIEPEGMIFFTDLCPSDEYPPEPAYPVLWVSYRGRR